MASAAQTFAPGTGVNSAPASAAQRARPFVQAAKHGRQLATQGTYTPGAAQIQIGPTPLPASGGFLRRIHIQAIASAGAGAGVGQGDYPWVLFNQIKLLEPNNTPILDLSGYNLLLADTYGGYAGSPDPRVDPDYSANGNNPNIQPYIPIELDPTGVGALADLSSSSAFQLFMAINPSASIWSTAPTTIPAVQVTTYQDYWTLPNPQDMDGNPQATTPPFPGTIQLWSQIPNISIANNQRQQLNRMGNQLRTVIIVARSAGARAEGAMPNPLSLRWDDVILTNTDLQTIRKTMREQVEGLTARDTGVYAIPYNFGVSRHVGGNGVSSYLPTVTATRYEISGANSGGTIDWIVNEVTSAPVSGVQRSTVGGGLGFYPPNPAPAAGTQ